MKSVPLLLVIALSVLPGAAQTVVFGPSARTAFEGYVTNPGQEFINFDSLPLGTALDTEFQLSHGVTFASIINTDGTPIGSPHNVYVSGSQIGQIVGTPFAGGADDGRVGYRITFATPQSWTGLMRNWQATYSLTRFYNSSGTLLAQHANTMNSEFVGWVADYGDPLTWVGRIELDGLVNGGSRQVGYSDDLFFGTTAIPEPATTAWVMIVSAAVATVVFRCRARRRRGDLAGQ